MDNQEYIQLKQRIADMVKSEKGKSTSDYTILKMVIGRITALAGSKNERVYTESQLAELFTMVEEHW